MATTLRRSLLQTIALLIGIIAIFQVFFLVGKFMAIQLKPYLNAENVSTANHAEGSYFNFNNNNNDDDDNNDYYYTRQNNNKSITPKSPACHPHFRLALPGNQWTNKVKFKRIYLYHLRKAGGSSLHVYFAKVAARHGLDFKVVEWSAMEEPGSLEDAETFYVTHIREPVSLFRDCFETCVCVT